MQLFFRELGENHDQAIIILHGLFGSSDNWLTLSKSLAEKYHVFLLDQRNHGRSPHSQIHHYQALSEDLKEFIDSQKLEKPILIGHSMGGKTVMNYVHSYNNWLSMIVVDMGLKQYLPHHQTILEAINSIDLQAISSRNDADLILQKYALDLGNRQFLLKSLYKDENDQFAWRMNLKLLSKDIKNIYEKLPFKQAISGKVLFVRGGNSNYVLDSDFAEIKQYFPDAQFETVAGAGHWVQAEKPADFLAIVQNFIS